MPAASTSCGRRQQWGRTRRRQIVAWDGCRVRLAQLPACGLQDLVTLVALNHAEGMSVLKRSADMWAESALPLPRLGAEKHTDDEPTTRALAKDQENRYACSLSSESDFQLRSMQMSDDRGLTAAVLTARRDSVGVSNRERARLTRTLAAFGRGIQVPRPKVVVDDFNADPCASTVMPIVRGPMSCPSGWKPRLIRRFDKSTCE